MTVTAVAAGGVTGSSPAFTSTSVTMTIPSAAIGQIVIVTYNGFKATPGATAPVTAPAGWTYLGGMPEAGAYAIAVSRSWFKVVTAADCSPHTVTWTYNAADWNAGFANSRQFYCYRFPGATRIIGPYASAHWTSGAGSWSPTMPPAGVPALGYIAKFGNYSGGTGMDVANGWTGGGASGPFLHVYAASPILPPAFNASLLNGVQAFWLTDDESPHCTVFEGRVDCVVGSSNVQLSVASSALPDGLSNYQFVFTQSAVVTTLPPPSLLSAGPWTIGAMAAGEHVSYYVYRLDGAHIDGSAVMRATDTTFGLFWDLTVQCTPFARQALIF